MSDYIERPEHDEFVKRMEEEHIRTNKRLANLEEAVAQNSNLAVSIERMAVSMEHMVQEQKRQGKRLEKLEEAPADNWNRVKIGFLSAVGGAIASALIASIIHYL